MSNRFAFVGGQSGKWRVKSVTARRGNGLPPMTHLSIVSTTAGQIPPDASLILHGVMSNLRYATRAEVTSLRARQEGLGRSQASCAALIPIKKSQAWWDLTQDERRAIFEEQSQHTAIGLNYLPAVARQLYHCRDLGEPFDFLTWFEYAPEHADHFEDMVTRLRATKEWSFVEREVDVRLCASPPPSSL